MSEQKNTTTIEKTEKIKDREKRSKRLEENEGNEVDWIREFIRAFPLAAV